MAAKPEATSQRHFRLTNAEVELIDRIGRAISPDAPVTRTSVLRLAIRELAERRLTRPARRS